MTAVTTATTAMTAALVKGVGQTAAYGDNVDKMSQKLGISAEAYQEWDAVMQHCGSSIESLKPSMKTLANAAADGNDSTAAAFNKLGLSMDEVSSMSQEDLFATVISRLQDMGESTERTAIASDLLGKAATELGPLFNSTSEETEAMRKRVHELGGVMSNEAVKSAAKYQDTLQDMKTTFSGVTRSLTQEFLPGFTDVMEGITHLLVGDSSAGVEELIGSGIGWISKALEKTIDRVVEMSKTVIPVMTTVIEELLPYLLEVGIHIIDSLVTAIVSAIPSLAESATQIMVSLSGFIIELLPKIIEAGAQAIVALSQGIAESLPELIPAIVDAVVLIVTTLIENIPLLLDAGYQVLMGIVDGLRNAFPELDTVWQYIEQVFAAAWQYVESVWNAAVSVFSVIWEGIKAVFAVVESVLSGDFSGAWDAIKGVWDAAKGYFQAIWDEIKAIFEVAEAILGPFFQAAWNAITSAWDVATGYFSDIWESIKTTFSAVSGTISGFFSDAWAAITGIADGWADYFGDIWEDIKKKFSSAIDKIKGFFDFDWSLPKIKLPHFSITGKFSLNPPQIPHFSVNWYRKAMDNAMLLNDATIFGTAGGKLLGGGEAGPEVVSGADTLMNMIGKTVRENMRGFRDEEPITIVVQSILDGNAIGEYTYTYLRRRQIAYDY